MTNKMLFKVDNNVNDHKLNTIAYRLVSLYKTFAKIKVSLLIDVDFVDQSRLNKSVRLIKVKKIGTQKNT